MVRLGVMKKGFGGWWRADEICGQGKEVLESEGKRVFEFGEDGFDEVVKRVRAFIEVNELNRTAEEEYNVEESEWERGGRN